MSQQAVSSTYFNLHTTGIGYLNRAREVPVKRSDAFLAVTVAGLHGATDDVQYTYFDCRVSGQDAQELIKAHLDEINAQGKSVLIGFNIGDIYVDTFVYDAGPKAGQTGASLKGRLLRIDWMKIDGVEIYRAPRKEKESASSEVPVPDSAAGAPGLEREAA